MKYHYVNVKDYTAFMLLDGDIVTVRDEEREIVGRCVEIVDGCVTFDDGAQFSIDHLQSLGFIIDRDDTDEFRQDMYAKIPFVIKAFDFERVHSIMNALKITLPGSVEPPTIVELVLFAQSLLYKAINDCTQHCAQGSCFYAEVDKEEISLTFCIKERASL